MTEYLKKSFSLGNVVQLAVLLTTLAAGYASLRSDVASNAAAIADLKAGVAFNTSSIRAMERDGAVMSTQLNGIQSDVAEIKELILNYVTPPR